MNITSLANKTSNGDFSLVNETTIQQNQKKNFQGRSKLMEAKKEPLYLIKSHIKLFLRIL